MNSSTKNQLAFGILTFVAFLGLGCSNSDPTASSVPDASNYETARNKDADNGTIHDLGVAVEGYSRLHVSRTEDILIAKFVDRRLDESAGDIGDEFLRLVGDAHAKKIILDFSSVEFFSDTPLEKLMALKAEVDSQSKQLRLCSLRGDVAEVFQIMHFDKVFNIDPDVDAALDNAR